MKFISIFILSFSLFYSSTTYGNHLRNKSNSEALGTHKARMGKFTNRFQKEIILPSTHPKALKDTSKLNAKIQDIMSKSDLLSVLFYDGNSITVNELYSKKFKKSDKMYSMSIAKSYVGYLVSTFQGSTETTFYVLAVYFGAVGIRRVRHAIVAAICADIMGIVAAVFIVSLLYGP